MTKNEFRSKVVNRRLELIKKVLGEKGIEYGADKSAFHNFDHASQLSFHTTPQGVAWEFMCKHLQSIKDMIADRETNGKIPSNELVEEKIGDAINYLILIEGMFKKEIIEQKDTTSPELKIKYRLIENEP